ncbi:MAG TPA: hypothetical protein VJT72_00875, partial [Pseudonocardiaceae bacterium]|nr:hypothetical protein [Pseudonocardiaceae bacterium]
MPTEFDAKQVVRKRVWSRLAQASPEPYGQIPDFVGAAAARLAELPAWGRAQVIKANPAQPQLPVRGWALREGKLVYMAVPKLAAHRAGKRVPLRQRWDVHSRVIADQSSEVVRVTGEHNRGAGAERSCSDEGIYRVARVEPVSAQQVPRPGLDRTIGVSDGQPPKNPVHTGSAG